MSKRSRQEEESSLELLLDTMCNTFGGVMFIAISIFVIILPPEKSKSLTGYYITVIMFLQVPCISYVFGLY